MDKGRYPDRAVSEYGDADGHDHMDPRYRGLDGRDGAAPWYQSLPTVRFDSNIKSKGTISADYSPQSPTRPEGKPNTDGLGG